MPNPQGSDNFKGDRNPAKAGKGSKGGKIGRPPGSPNKISREVKEAITKAFAKVGGAKYLEQVARNNPAVFCTLLGKLLPAELATSSGPLKHEVVLKWMTPEMARARGFMTDEAEEGESRAIGQD